MAKIYAQVLHGDTGKNYINRRKRPEAIDDTPDYLGNQRRVAARPVRPADPQVLAFDGQGEPIMQANTKRRPGQMPLAIENDIIERNRADRAVDHAEMRAKQKQVDRRAAAIHALQPRATESYDEMMKRPGLAKPSLGAARPIVPAVAPAVQPAGAMGSSGSFGSEGLGGDEFGLPSVGDAMIARGAGSVATGGARAVPSLGPQPAQLNAINTIPALPDIAASGIQPNAALDTTPVPAPQAALQRVQAVAPTIAANAGSGAINADTEALAGRMEAIPTIQGQFGGDVGAYQRAQQVRQANQQMQRPQAVLPPNPVEAFGGGQPLTTQPRQRVLAIDPNRAALLQQQVNAGQQAIDTGTSLEEQRRKADEQVAFERQRSLAAALNPPRTGTAAQPKPPAGLDRMDADLQAQHAAYTAALRNMRPTIRVLSKNPDGTESATEIPNPAYEDILKRIDGVVQEQKRRTTEGLGKAGGATEPPKAAPTQDEVNTVVGEIRKANPTWTADQIKAEAKKRLSGG